MSIGEEFLTSIDPDLVQKGTKPSSMKTLQSGLEELDGFLKERGGMQYGRIVEWGMPPGRGGRFVIARFLSRITTPLVWILGLDNVEVYPPAWARQGVDLSLCHFIRSARPLPQLRPLFMEPVFRLMVMDCPQKLTVADWSFIKARVRSNQQLLFVIRPFFLSQKRGNPQAHLRINCHLHGTKGEFHLSFIKGAEGHLVFPMERIRPL